MSLNLRRDRVLRALATLARAFLFITIGHYTMHFHIALQDIENVPYRDYVSFNTSAGSTLLKPRKHYRLKLLLPDNTMTDISHVTYNHTTTRATAYMMDHAVSHYTSEQDIPVVVMEGSDYRAFI